MGSCCSKGTTTDALERGLPTTVEPREQAAAARAHANNPTEKCNRLSRIAPAPPTAPVAPVSIAADPRWDKSGFDAWTRMSAPFVTA
eukprot:5681696-Prymnesium_polylepis.1